MDPSPRLGTGFRVTRTYGFSFSSGSPTPVRCWTPGSGRVSLTRDSLSVASTTEPPPTRPHSETQVVMFRRSTSNPPRAAPLHYVTATSGSIRPRKPDPLLPRPGPTLLTHRRGRGRRRAKGAGEDVQGRPWSRRWPEDPRSGVKAPYPGGSTGAPTVRDLIGIPEEQGRLGPPRRTDAERGGADRAGWARAAAVRTSGRSRGMHPLHVLLRPSPP